MRRNSTTILIIYFLLAITVLCSQAKLAYAENSISAAGVELSPEAQQLINDVASAVMQEGNREIELTNQALKDLASNAELLGQLLDYLGEIGNSWTDETWNRFLDIFNQAGVAVDELIPSVSGCISDDQGRPMKGVLVAMIPRATSPSGSTRPMLPSFAITGNGTVEEHPGNHSSFGFSAGLPTLPVSNSFLPQSYQEKFNRGGCYLVPVPPQLMRIYLSMVDISTQWYNETFGVDEGLYTFDAIIHPMFPGYNMGPYEQRIVFKPGGLVEVTNVDTGDTRTVRAQ